MAKKINYEKRMYSLVIYQLSGIQKGIQAGHATEEYAENYGKNIDFLDWRKNWKTVILLNGGTSNSGKISHYNQPKQLGSMEQHLKSLQYNKIKCTPFYEPDLNYALTAISFLVDERVFNNGKYPPWEDAQTEDIFTSKEFKEFYPKEVRFLKEFLQPFKLAL